uniref:Uncharacterized protein n=1 Tax=Rhizophora mucronata TaxID=61149 RepID=A0A2P2Q4B6_RHIMU
MPGEGCHCQHVMHWNSCCLKKPAGF